MMAHLIYANSVTWTPRIGKFHLGPLDLQLKNGCFVAIVGPNGSGKSSLLKLIAGLDRPKTGTLTVAEHSPWKWHPRQRGRTLAYLSQDPVRPFGFSLQDYIALGRFPFLGPFRGLTPFDADRVASEIDRWGLHQLAHRSISTLSGGEFQRTRLAQAMTQSPRLLLLDEPGNNLDIQSRITILRRLKRESQEGISILAVIHDINDALLYADEVWLMNQGSIIKKGVPNNVLSPETLETIYGIKLTRFEDAEGHCMLGIP